MSLMEVLPGWLQEVMEYDPRDRDFRRDFYEDDVSKALQLLRAKAVVIGKRDIFINSSISRECDTFNEIKFRLSEAMNICA